MLLLASYYGRKDCLTVFIMLPPRQTGRRGHNVLSVSVRSSVRSFHRSFFWYQTREHDNLNTNEPVLMPFVTNGPRGKCVNRVHFTRAAAEASYGRSQSSSLVCFMHFMISVGCPMCYFVSFTGNSVLFFNTFYLRYCRIRPVFISGLAKLAESWGLEGHEIPIIWAKPQPPRYMHLP